MTRTSFALLRRTVSGIGLFVAATTALALPLGYGLLSYQHEADRLAFEARLNAGRVAKYAYQHGSTWSFHRVRVAELIELADLEHEAVRQRVRTTEGRVVLEESTALASPTFARSAPVLVSGKEVGSVEIEVSARPLLVRTLLCALLSFTLGLVAYGAIRVLPLRVLDRTLGRLAERERQLSTTNGRFEAALGNMAHGLCMFDRSRRLVLCNARYAGLYGLPEHLTQPGTALQDIFAFRKAAGNAPVEADSILNGGITLPLEGETSTFIRKLQNGRTVRIGHQSMPGGGYVASHEDITHQVEAETRMAHMAHHDALTGLPNRVSFHAELERVLPEARQGSGFAVLCLDLDRFKAVNDTFGHPAGDALLRAVAKRVSACMRDTDTLVRLGGDEFAIIQRPAATPEQATVLAQQIIEAVGQPFDLDGHHVVIGTSVGIALAPGDGDHPDRLLKCADMALYRAKADGRGTYHFFEPEMDARMQARRELELDLRTAMARGEFEVHYQPLISLETNKVSGFEALLRWTQSERGRVSPADFIPLAEEIGLIGQIGAWVLNRACTDAATWPDDVRVAVNLSPAQFTNRRLALDVVSALMSSGLAPYRLEMEITETVMLQDTEATLATLHQLRDLGVRISMDDFGTGYSSLSYLRRFPFDKIKIDKSFVRDLPESVDAVAIVRAVAGLGASLGMSITAEGVETEGQLAKIRAEGCTEVQGWLFSPARPAGDVPALIRELTDRARAAA